MESSQWGIGAAAAVIGSFGAGLGENLIRLSYSQLSLTEAPPPLWKRPLWVTGWLMTTIVTSVCAVVGLAYAPLQLVMPIGGLHILFGVGIAHVLSGETLGKGGIVGAALVSIGVSIVLIGVDKQSPKVSFANIGDVVLRAHCLLFFVVWAACGCLLFFCTRRARKQLTSLDLSKLENRQYVNKQKNLQNNTDYEESARHYAKNLFVHFDALCSYIHPIAAPALSGMLSALSNLMLKLALSLAGDEHWAQADKSVFFFLTFMSIAAGVGQVICLNHSLECSPAIVVVPTANSVLITIGSSVGLLFSHNVTFKSIACLTLSISFVVAGIIFLAMRDSTHPHEDHNDHKNYRFDAEEGHVLKDDPLLCEKEALHVANLSFGSCASSRSFGGYIENISFNRHDNAEEFKKSFYELGKKLHSIRRERSSLRDVHAHGGGGGGGGLTPRSKEPPCNLSIGGSSCNSVRNIIPAGKSPIVTPISPPKSLIVSSATGSAGGGSVGSTISPHSTSTETKPSYGVSGAMLRNVSASSPYARTG